MQHIKQQGRIVEALLIFLKRLTPIAKWALTILLIIYAFTGITTVEPHQNALIERFGKLQPEVHKPGILFALPQPFDKIILFDADKEMSIELNDWTATGDKKLSFRYQREMTEEEKDAADFAYEDGSGRQMTVIEDGDYLHPLRDGYAVTADSNLIQGNFTLRYRIDQPFMYYSSGSAVHTLLQRLTYRSMTHQLATHTIDEAMTTSREDITQAAIRSIQEQSNALGLGVNITTLEINALTPPTQVIASFEDVINAKQAANTMIENARSSNAQQIRKARSEAQQIISRARSYANKTVNKANGESQAFLNFYAEYQKQPFIITERVYWDSIDTVFSKVNSRSILPKDSAPPTIILDPSPSYKN